MYIFSVLSFAITVFILGVYTGLSLYRYELTPDVYDSHYTLCENNDGLKHIYIQLNDTHTVCNNGAVFTIVNTNAD